jgi:hypothetical protein
MIQLYQKITQYNPAFNRLSNAGDCIAATIGSILDMNYDLIPAQIKICNVSDKQWYEKLNNWLLQAKGMMINWYTRQTVEQYKLQDRRYAIGILDYGCTTHAVVTYSGKIVHDPNPYNSGKKHEGIKWYGIFIKNNQFISCKGLRL